MGCTLDDPAFLHKLHVIFLSKSFSESRKRSPVQFFPRRPFTEGLSYRLYFECSKTRVYPDYGLRGYCHIDTGFMCQAFYVACIEMIPQEHSSGQVDDQEERSFMAGWCSDYITNSILGRFLLSSFSGVARTRVSSELLAGTQRWTNQSRGSNCYEGKKKKKRKKKGTCTVPTYRYRPFDHSLNRRA